MFLRESKQLFAFRIARCDKVTPLIFSEEKAGKSQSRPLDVAIHLSACWRLYLPIDALNIHPEVSGEGHFGNCDEWSAVRNVMTSIDDARRNRRSNEVAVLLLRIEVHLW